MTPDARRLEELSLNSSAPPGQLLYDGWLLRLLPGKAKRARSVNAVYPSTLPLEEKIAYCERLYGAAAPAGALPHHALRAARRGWTRRSSARGYGRFDTTAVESAPHRARARSTARAPRSMNLRDWVRGGGRAARLVARAPRRRTSRAWRACRSPMRARRGARGEGRVVATGLTIVEDDCAGLFDIVTARSTRAGTRATGRGPAARAWSRRAQATCRSPGQQAGARLYRQFGFEERYLYWYRGRDGEQN